MIAKMQSITSTDNHSAELFRVVQGLFHHSSKELGSNHAIACCNQFATYFAGKKLPMSTLDKMPV